MGDVNGQFVARTVVPPPGEQPLMKEVWARARHGAHEFVPRVASAANSSSVEIFSNVSPVRAVATLTPIEIPQALPVEPSPWPETLARRRRRAAPPPPGSRRGERAP